MNKCLLTVLVTLGALLPATVGAQPPVYLLQWARSASATGSSTLPAEY